MAKKEDLKADLAKFLGNRKPRETRRKCWTCSIPERDVIDDAFLNNTVRDDVLAEWLMLERGYGETIDYGKILWRIRNHKYSRHYEGGKPVQVLG